MEGTMSDEQELPDLFPWDLAPEVVLTPARILKRQAELIEEKSGGRLKGELEHGEDEKYSTWDIVVTAPSLDYSARLFSCYHAKFLPYPITIESRVLSGGVEKADTELDFRNIVEKIFRSDYVRSVFQSLLARVGEVSEQP
jgi:hypothetical protein